MTVQRILNAQNGGNAVSIAPDAGLDEALEQLAAENVGALVVSSPNYASQVCGPMITFMNRHYCLLDKDWKVRVHPGIKLVGVFAQGNGNPENYGAQYNWYLGDFQNRDMVLVDMLIHAGRQPLSRDGELMRRAYNTGRNL